jgi:Uma2 family endonuclease
VAVVHGTPRDAGHPRSAALVLEVADWSLRLDRQTKARVYARAGIADYWIVNLVDRVLAVYREPVAEGRRGARYRDVRLAGPGERVAPLAAPNAASAVADLLP